ncbi:MAG: flagellar basal-body rod protein FlgG [Rhodospirillales bacterium]
MNPLYIAATGMVAQQQRVDVIANNLANMNTTGYQRRRASFNDLLYEDQKRPNNKHSRADGIVPGGVKAGLGVHTASFYRVVEQGNLAQTGSPFDLAIQGSGYMQVTLANGETGYTRAGAFQLNQNGQLVTHDGLPLSAGISIPPGALEVTVNNSGQVLASFEGQAQPQNLGQINLVRFPNEGGLNAIGDSLFQETAGSGAPLVGVAGTPGFGTILQGFLETSNVNPVEEIANMVKAMRAYELSSKVVQTADQMMSTKSG